MVLIRQSQVGLRVQRLQLCSPWFVWPDHVNRQLKAPRPDALWVADVTHVATSSGCACAAFIVGAYARRIVGWRVSRPVPTGFVLDALDQALRSGARCSAGGLVHHSDTGSRHEFICHTERLAQAGIERSVSGVGDSYDNALAKEHQLRLRGRGRSPARRAALARGHGLRDA